MRIHQHFAPFALAVCCTGSSFGHASAANNSVSPFAVSYTIEKQIDAERHVNSAIVRNNRFGDVLVEFSVVHDGDTREWWTVTLLDDPDFYFHVHVDDVWIYSGSRSQVNGTQVVELSVPGTIASVDVANPCVSPQFAMFQDIIVQIEPTAALIDVVLDALADADASTDPDVEPACEPDGEAAQACNIGCGESTLSCTGLTTCADKFACCTANTAIIVCWHHCRCDHQCPAEGVNECKKRANGIGQRRNMRCWSFYLECLGNENCDD